MRRTPHNRSSPELRGVFDAIAAGDDALLSRLVRAEPGVAREAATTGATRQDPASHFFPSLGHYLYAGDTPLHFAAAAHAPDMVRELLAAGARVGARNRRGAEPLHYAADGNPASPAWHPGAQASVIRALIEAGGDPEAEDNSGVTPLHRAVRSRCAAAVEALLAGGAGVRHRNRAGSTPLHLAVQTTGRGGSGSPQARAQQAEIIRILLAHGARPADRNGAGHTVHECATAEWLRGLVDRR